MFALSIRESLWVDVCVTSCPRIGVVQSCICIFHVIGH